MMGSQIGYHIFFFNLRSVSINIVVADALNVPQKSALGSMLSLFRVCL
jgi:hypothetical protein